MFLFSACFSVRNFRFPEINIQTDRVKDLSINTGINRDRQLYMSIKEKLRTLVLQNNWTYYLGK